MAFSVISTLHTRQTDFQKIDILDTDVFGKALLLDGHIQLTDFDERAYHESLVQIPAMSVPELKNALVVGGGDGGVIRELCRHRGLEHIDMIEIDRGVIEACTEFMPGLSNGAFDDPRVHLHIEDAFQLVKQINLQYDLIVVDSTDTYEDEEGEISEMLWTEEFYNDLKSKLSPGGMVVTQADNHVYCPYSAESTLGLLAKVFPETGFYYGLVPSFGGYSGFAWGSLETRPSSKFEPKEIELKYLNTVTYDLAFTPLQFS